VVALPFLKIGRRVFLISYVSVHVTGEFTLYFAIHNFGTPSIICIK
jgi:hypothetical protein